MKAQKFCITTENITGMTHIISGILFDLNIDIHAMEVIPGKVYIKLNILSEESKKALNKKLSSHENIISVETISFLPIEIHQKNLEAILAAIQEVVVAVDLSGKIILYNPVAEDKMKGNIENATLGDLLGSKNSHFVLSILKGENFNDEEIWLTIGGKTETFYFSAHPLLDEDDQLIGALLTFVPGAQMKKIAFRFQRPELNSFNEIIYQSKAMEKAVQRAKQAAQSGAPVMLRGESGTGKELFARAIHHSSKRRKMPFVPINCAAIPDSLIESELFGYEPGAFTGAGSKRKIGLIEVADGGTLFLDEVGELPLQIQAKLLRVLQDGKVRRIGAHEQHQVNFRVVAATNKNLEEMVVAKQFREDLYYRLNVVPVDIPALNMREGDIPLLIEHFLDSYARKNDIKKIKVSNSALRNLSSHNWHGNVRELENVLERALSQMGDKPEVNEEMLVFDSFRGFNIDSKSENRIIVNHIVPLQEFKEIAEEAIIRFAFDQYPSTRKLAGALGVSHMTIANKLNKYGINRI